MSSEIGRIIEASLRVLRTEGVGTFISKAARYSKTATTARIEAIKTGAALLDLVILVDDSPAGAARAEQIREQLLLNGWRVLIRRASETMPGDARYFSLAIIVGRAAYHALSSFRSSARTYRRPIVLDLLDESAAPDTRDAESVGDVALYLLNARDAESAPTLNGAPTLAVSSCLSERQMQLLPKAERGAKHVAATVAQGSSLSRALYSCTRKSIAFVLPSTNVSGGVNVVMDHARLLQEAGYDVTILTTADEASREQKFADTILSVVAVRSLPCDRSFDVMVATFFTTVAFVLKYPRVHHRVYLVQGYETDFLEYGHPLRFEAEGTYSPLLPIKKVTVSGWCKEWLKSRFGANADLIPNTLDRAQFPPKNRDFSGKIRILIEGDPSNEFKNLDESFAIANSLDRARFEVWFLSSNARPKDWYQCERAFQKVPYAEVPELYQQCHILLKTSLLESFSYPPLEMMSTGGYVVAIGNHGNAEYLAHGENCLLFTSGDTAAALSHIHSICQDPELRARLRKGAESTIQSRLPTHKLPVLQRAYFGSETGPLRTETTQQPLIREGLLANDKFGTRV